jgi:hypothetical protein
MMGIRAIVYDDAIDHISIHDSDILLTSFKLRSILDDFIDCLILSSAINQCDALITEDSDILNLNKNKEFNELLATANSKFKIRKLAEIL